MLLMEFIVYGAALGYFSALGNVLLCYHPKKSSKLVFPCKGRQNKLVKILLFLWKTKLVHMWQQL